MLIFYVVINFVSDALFRMRETYSYEYLLYGLNKVFNS